MKLKKMIVFMILLVAFFLLPCFSSGAYSDDTSYPAFKLTKLIEFGDTKFLSVEVTNNSSDVYSFGWVKSCRLEVKTSDGIFTKVINSGTIERGTKVYTYKLEAPGKLKELKYTDIKLLGSNGLPISLGVGYDISSDVNVLISDYFYLNAVPLTIIAVAVLAILIVVIILFTRKKGFGIIRIVGIVLSVIGILTFIYSFYSFIIKPVLGQSDFEDVSMKYWVLCIVGMIIVGIGTPLAALPSRRKSNVHSNNYNTYNRNNNQRHSDLWLNDDMYRRSIQENQIQFQEQNRLFQEQMQREQQEFTDQMLRDQEQNQRDQEQFQNQQYEFMDRMNQQSFDNFNDFNNFNNF